LLNQQQNIKQDEDSTRTYRGVRERARERERGGDNCNQTKMEKREKLFTR